MRSFVVLLLGFSTVLVWTLQESHVVVGLNDNNANVFGDFGDPIPDLDPAALNRFERGRNVFKKRFKRSQGLGPHFNATSCSSCHEDPVPGGSSQRYRDFFLAAASQAGGSMAKLYADCTNGNAGSQNTELCLPSVVMPHYGPKGTIASPVAAEVEHPKISAAADLVARRNAPPLFGVGLFRLVSDEEIISRVDPDDSDQDGISGRVNLISAADGRVGRFGYKCQTASIEAFNRGALNNQMGITTDSTELVGAPGPDFMDKLLGIRTAYAQIPTPRDRLVDQDGVPDPELGRVSLKDLIFFQENLAAPRRGPITREVLRGEKVFDRIRCTDCHVPSLPTLLGRIHAFTDLLLHDLGPENADGIVMEQATGSEFRTQPLWGLCQHAPFLHGGSADTVQEAILRHGGEASASRDHYLELDENDLRDLHRFLESL